MNISSMSTQQKIKKLLLIARFRWSVKIAEPAKTSLRFTALDLPASITYMAFISQLGADFPSLCAQQI